MAVITTRDPKLRPFAGKAIDFSVPLNYWTFEETANADASGGSLTIECSLKAGVLYSVELVAVDTNAGAGVDPRVLLNTNDAAFDIGVTFVLAAPESGARATQPHQLNAFRGLVFRPDGVAILSAQLNNVVGRTLNLVAWGFTWDLEAQRSPTGPVRPRGA